MSDKKVIAIFETSMGTFKAELFAKEMPLTCGNFVDLVKMNFYDGLHIHRVCPKYMIQFGCPYTKEMQEIDVAELNKPDDPNMKYELNDDDEEEDLVGKGSAPPDSLFQGMDGKENDRDEEGNIADEMGGTKPRISNTEGTISMANAGIPDTGGSQFFINLDKNDKLDWWNSKSESMHPVFGKVIEGYEEVVKKIESVELYCEKPVKPIKMISVRIEEK